MTEYYQNAQSTINLIYNNTYYKIIIALTLKKNVHEIESRRNRNRSYITGSLYFDITMRLCISKTTYFTFFIFLCSLAGNADELLQIVTIVYHSRERGTVAASDKTLETFGTGTNAVSCENTEI